MHVLIYNPLYKGHHLNWVRLLADACAPYAQRVTFATCAQAAASPEFGEHLRVMPANFAVDDSMGALELTGKRFEGPSVARRGWADLDAAIRRHKPDRVYIPHADILAMARIPRGTALPIDPSRIDAIFLSASFAYGGLSLRQRLRSFYEFRGFRQLPVGRLLLIDPIAHEWLRENHAAIARRSELLPDPVSPVGIHDKCAARSELGLPVDGRWISCVGVLDSRKGVDEFVDAFAAAPLAPTDRLLLAGSATPPVHAAVAAARARIGDGRIFMLDRLLSNREFALSVSAADLVAVAHRFPDHLGSASVLIRAVAAERPVLASEAGWPGYVTRENSLGWIYPQARAHRPQAIARSLSAAQGFGLSPPARAFADFHSVSRFREILTAPLRDTARVQPVLLEARNARPVPTSV
jgi:glycosyltransferase involved in cell wall biosynthesis